ncbi:MAG: glycosyltransferase family 4 protein [Parcubacteria group bacterium]|nr:glycosyltransferase family 4 protein [Parcubacteria group bacterium]
MNTLKQFNLEEDKYIMTCARLVKHKGIHYLIEAFNFLKEEQKNDPRVKELKLVIVGDSSYTDDYIKYVKSLAFNNKDIIFTGFQTGKTLEELYKNAYFYAHPSEAEGLSVSILEAMGYRKAVLVSNIPENIEAFAGRGYMFVNKDVEDLKYKIKLLLANPELVKKTGERAYNYVMENYNWENITSNTVNLYEDVVSEPKIKLKYRFQRARA